MPTSGIGRWPGFLLWLAAALVFYFEPLRAGVVYWLYLGSVDTHAPAVFLVKNPRLRRQKCSQDVQSCCAFFLAYAVFASKNRFAECVTTDPGERQLSVAPLERPDFQERPPSAGVLAAVSGGGLRPAGMVWTAGYLKLIKAKMMAISRLPRHARRRQTARACGIMPPFVFSLAA